MIKRESLGNACRPELKIDRNVLLQSNQWQVLWLRGPLLNDLVTLGVQREKTTKLEASPPVLRQWNPKEGYRQGRIFNFYENGLYSRAPVPTCPGKKEPQKTGK